ncbi:MAG: hypothetical protein ACLS9K_06160 [Lachnospira eligens]
MCFPASECDEDIDAARAESFKIVTGNMTFNHTIFCDMTCLGRYPDIAGTGLHLEKGLEKSDIIKNSHSLKTEIQN